MPPVYPFDKLDALAELARRHEGGVVDLSVGTPCDPPPAVVLQALAASGAERGYPVLDRARASTARPPLAWMSRRFGVVRRASAVAACIGTKEFVAGVPHWLAPEHARSATRCCTRSSPIRPTRWVPSSPGAVPSRCRPRRTGRWTCRRSRRRTPLGRCACGSTVPATRGDSSRIWGRRRAGAARNGVPVFSDECYVEFTWAGPGRTILEHGPEGVVAVHSLSKRSNLAGLRVGFFAGDR